MPTNAELQEQAKKARQERDEILEKYQELEAKQKEEAAQDQTKPMNIHQKIVAIRSEVEIITKDSEGSAGRGHTFKYASTNSLLKEIKSKMDDLGVILYPEIPAGLAHETYTYKTSSGERTDFIVDGVVNYVWQNADDPADKLAVPWHVKGQQNDISKAFGSGMTYAERYFIFKFLNIPTDEDDPDNQNNHDNKGPQRGAQGENGLSNSNTRGGQQKNGVGLILSHIDELTQIAGTSKTEVQNLLSEKLEYGNKRFKEMDEQMQQKIVAQLEHWIKKYKEGGGKER